MSIGDRARAELGVMGLIEFFSIEERLLMPSRKLTILTARL